MTPLANWIPLAAACGLGAVVAAIITWAILGRRQQRRLLGHATQLAAAETSASAEADRRRQAEAELEEEQTLRTGLDREIAVANERALRATEMIEQQKEFLAGARKELETAFKALSATALEGSSEQFLKLAEQRLNTQRQQASADLEERKQAIQNLLKPLSETLTKVESRSQEIEKARVEAYSRIDEQVRQLAEATAGLNEKTTSLETALKSSQVRGQWGEIALRNVAELAGMTEHCDFDEQQTLDGGGRPDMTVNLPGNRRIAVDAKAPLTGYMEAVEATDETSRKSALQRYVRTLREHIRTLANRDYASLLDEQIDLVVMFLPGDPFLSAAFSQEPNLQVEALRSKVLIATPTTLVGLLRTVAIYWQQQSLAENAEAIAQAAQELYKRAAKFGDELSAVGKGLQTALGAYNRAVGSFDSRLIPMAKRIEDLKVTEQAKTALKTPDSVDSEVRSLKPRPNDD